MRLLLQNVDKKVLEDHVYARTIYAHVQSAAFSRRFCSLEVKVALCVLKASGSTPILTFS